MLETDVRNRRPGQWLSEAIRLTVGIQGFGNLGVGHPGRELNDASDKILAGSPQECHLATVPNVDNAAHGEGSCHSGSAALQVEYVGDFPIGVLACELLDSDNHVGAGGVRSRIDPLSLMPRDDTGLPADRHIHAPRAVNVPQCHVFKKKSCHPIRLTRIDPGVLT